MAGKSFRADAHIEACLKALVERRGPGATESSVIKEAIYFAYQQQALIDRVAEMEKVLHELLSAAYTATKQAYDTGEQREQTHEDSAFARIALEFFLTEYAPKVTGSVKEKFEKFREKKELDKELQLFLRGDD